MTKRVARGRSGPTAPRWCSASMPAATSRSCVRPRHRTGCGSPAGCPTPSSGLADRRSSFGSRSAGFVYHEVTTSTTGQTVQLDAAFDLPASRIRVTRHYAATSGSPTFETWTTITPLAGTVTVSDLNAFKLAVVTPLRTRSGCSRSARPRSRSTRFSRPSATTRRAARPLRRHGARPDGGAESTSSATPAILRPRRSCVACRAGRGGLPVRALAAVHRIGRLAVGDLAVIVAVSCPHRGEAFDASRRLIDDLKHEVPIWKHQTFADGTEEWVGAC